MTEALLIAISILLAGAYLGHIIEQTFSDFYEEEEMPDQELDDREDPDEEVVLSDEITYGSDALHQKNEAFDERIEALKKDLEQPPGVLFPEDHTIVDKQYIQVPPEEYAK